LLQKKIKDEKVLWLLKIIIKSNNKELGKGIPIGNLTSQLFANIYLNKLDQFVKHCLRIKHYIRYMDDFLVLSYNKRELRIIKEQIQEFLQNRLGLELHLKKANIFPANKGIDFLGYVNFENYRLLRKSTVKRFLKRTNNCQKNPRNSLQSWLAYAKFGNSWRLRKSLSTKLKTKLCLTKLFIS